MPDRLQLKRGPKAMLPSEALDGELLFCTDTKELYVGVEGGVEPIVMESANVLTSDIPVPATIGGIQKGTTFKDMPLVDVILNLLYPYAAPEIKLTINQANLIESGLSLNGTVCTIKVKKAMYPIQKILLYKNDMLLQTWNSIPESDFATYLTFLFSDDQAITQQTTYKLAVEDKKQITYASLAIDFELPVYTGSCATLNPTAVEIGQAAKSIKRKANLSCTYTTNNSRMMLIYPRSWGALSYIKDVNQFDITNTFTQQIIQHTTQAGSQQYYCYVSNLTTVTNFKVNFNF